MMTSSDQNPMLRRYLLGDVPEGEAERIEEEFFVSDDRFGELLDAEDDLVESFLHNQLGPRDRQLFEGRFLATERGRGKVAIAALIEKAAPSSRFTSRRRWLAIAAAVLLLAISAGVLREFVVLRHQIDQLQGNQKALRTENATRSAEIDRLKRGIAFSIVLASAERGSAAASTIVLPRDAEAAELWLIIPRDDHPTYGVSLQTIDGRTLWSGAGLRSRIVDSRKAVVARVPSSTLAPETYIVSVMGEKVDGSTEPIEDFSFSIRRP